jgi:hypothetical protein
VGVVGAAAVAKKSANAECFMAKAMKIVKRQGPTKKGTIQGPKVKVVIQGPRIKVNIQGHR